MAKKKCIKIICNEDETKIVYLCVDDIENISKKIYKDGKEKKFKTIIECIFRNITNRDIYEKYSSYPGTSVMKLSKGKENLRIYCKIEIDDTDEENLIQKITMVKLHHKKDQSLSKKEISILEAIQKNEYEYKNWYPEA